MTIGLSLAACVRVLELGDPAGPDAGSTEFPTDADAADADGDGDSATSGPEALCVPANALGYRLPSVRWGLAAAYASRRLDDRPDTALHLSPAWFLAIGWQSTGFSCGPYGDPWVAGETDHPDEGCLALPEGTVWNELCRLFPNDYGCDGYAGTFTGDAPEASALGLGWYALAAHALLGRFELDPDDWYAASTDPRAVERLSAAMHLWGPWIGPIETIVRSCPDDVEACLTDPDLLRHVSGVADKLELLDAAPCFDDPLDADTVRAFVRALAAARPGPGRDWDRAEADAVAALTGAGFAADAPRVLDAIDAAAPVVLACPEQELYTWYRLPCP